MNRTCHDIHTPPPKGGVSVSVTPANRVDAILAAIDTGLQTAGDTAYGNDWPGTCWRCGEAAEDLCAGCREVLMAEVGFPPCEHHTEWLAPWQQRIVAECAEIDHINARSL